MKLADMTARLCTHTLGRNVVAYASCGSTQTELRRLRKTAPDGFTVIADEQLSGRGRTGNAFYSPKGEGLYVSFFVTEPKCLADALFTVRMSYALCRAVDRVTETESVGIKWVNDIYYREKKIAGILCERVTDGENDAILVGVGVNLALDKGKVPSDLKGKIGCLRDVTGRHIPAENLCAAILNETEELCCESPAPAEQLLAAYRKRSCVLGKEITVLKDGKELRAAALAVNETGALVVRYADGYTEALTGGMVSLRT